MPFRYQIDTESSLVVSTAWGVVTDEDLEVHQRTLAEDPLFDPGFRQLIDLSAVEEMALTSGGLWQRAHQNPWGEGALRAVVAPGDTAYGLARMFQIMNSNGPDDLRIFRDLDDARRWLGVGGARDSA